MHVVADDLDFLDEAEFDHIVVQFRVDDLAQGIAICASVTAGMFPSPHRVPASLANRPGQRPLDPGVAREWRRMRSDRSFRPGTMTRAATGRIAAATIATPAM